MGLWVNITTAVYESEAWEEPVYISHSLWEKVLLRSQLPNSINSGHFNYSKDIHNANSSI